MQIESIETYPIRIPLKPEFRMISALGRHECSDYVVVRLLCSGGAEGVGEATVMPRWSGETVWGAVAVIRDFLAPARACPVTDGGSGSRTRCAGTETGLSARACVSRRGKYAFLRVVRHGQ